MVEEVGEMQRNALFLFNPQPSRRPTRPLLHEARIWWFTAVSSWLRLRQWFGCHERDWGVGGYLMGPPPKASRLHFLGGEGVGEIWVPLLWDNVATSTWTIGPQPKVDATLHGALWHYLLMEYDRQAKSRDHLQMDRRWVRSCLYQCFLASMSLGLAYAPGTETGATRYICLVAYLLWTTCFVHVFLELLSNLYQTECQDWRICDFVFVV